MIVDQADKRKVNRSSQFTAPVGPEINIFARRADDTEETDPLVSCQEGDSQAQQYCGVNVVTVSCCDEDKQRKACQAEDLVAERVCAGAQLRCHLQSPCAVAVEQIADGRRDQAGEGGIEKPWMSSAAQRINKGAGKKEEDKRNPYPREESYQVKSIRHIHGRDSFGPVRRNLRAIALLDPASHVFERDIHLVDLFEILHCPGRIIH